MKLFIHIGMAKTGTSAIQNFLHNNRELLLENDFLYPLSGQFSDHSHHELAFSLYEENVNVSSTGSVEILRELKSEICSANVKNVILSSECFRSLLDSREFLSVFDNYEIYIICFVRNPVDYFESWYRQWVKDPVQRLEISFNQFFDEYANSLSLYELIQNRWLDKNRRVQVLVRDYDVDKKDNLIKNFLNYLDIGYIYPDNELKRKVTNQSLCYTGTKIMLLVNQLHIDEKQRHMFLSQCLGLEDPEALKGKRFISSEQAEFLNKKYANEYKYFLEKYDSWNLNGVK